MGKRNRDRNSDRKDKKKKRRSKKEKYKPLEFIKILDIQLDNYKKTPEKKEKPKSPKPQNPKTPHVKIINHYKCRTSILPIPNSVSCDNSRQKEMNPETTE